jgi:hypothetical protein
LLAAESLRFVLGHTNEDDPIPDAPLPPDLVGGIVFPLLVVKLVDRNLLPPRFGLDGLPELLRREFSCLQVLRQQ